MRLVFCLWTIACLYVAPRHVFCLTLRNTSTTLEKLNLMKELTRQLLDTIPDSKPIDCTEIMHDGVNESGIYEILPWNKHVVPDSFHVYCDMDTDGGGWTVIQRRGDFGQPVYFFYQNWKTYSLGFGNPEEDFWLGNEKLYYLTNQGNYSLRIDMKDMDGNNRYAQYEEFRVGKEIDLYKLLVSGYSGDAGDCLSENSGNIFKTHDKIGTNYRGCPDARKGGWWYSNCGASNLNGLYLKGYHEEKGKGVEWNTLTGDQFSLSDVEMKIRRTNSNDNIIHVKKIL